jgi:hypothetical protein
VAQVLLQLMAVGVAVLEEMVLLVQEQLVVSAD